MDYAVARKKAIRLLSMRNYHASLLARKLEQKGCPKEICERVIQDCRKMGFLDDEQAILSELRRGWGPRAIAYRLQLEKSEVKKWIPREAQKNQIKKMLPKLGEREKAIRTLQRRGFDFDLVIEIFSLIELH
jgi:SOS response regulatory protein OraA/RecX